MDDIPVSPLPNKQRKRKPFYKKWWVWIIAIAIVAVFTHFGFGFDFGFGLIDEMFHSYEELDVSGEPIAKACEIVKGQGWKVRLGLSNDIDCHNTKYVVEKTSYYRSSKEATIYYTLPKINESTLIGLPVNEACSKVKELDWKVDSVRQNEPGNYQEISTCSGSEIVEEVKTSGTYVTFYVHTDSPLPKKESSSSSSSGSSASNNSSSSSSSTDSSSSSGSSSSSSSSSNVSTTNSSFRKVMNDYESFMNRYVEFMKKYKNSSDVASMLSDYSKMMQDYAKYAESIQGYSQSSLSADDWAYYLEVTTRVNKKLLEVQ